MNLLEPTTLPKMGSFPTPLGRPTCPYPTDPSPQVTTFLDFYFIHLIFIDLAHICVTLKDTRKILSGVACFLVLQKRYLFGFHFILHCIPYKYQS